jgi:hypothetical protein
MNGKADNRGEINSFLVSAVEGAHGERETDQAEDIPAYLNPMTWQVDLFRFSFAQFPV